MGRDSYDGIQLSRCRAKDHNGNWVYGNHVFIMEGSGEEHCIWDSYNNIGIPIDIDTLCRFTGWKDDEGKDIYEYDVFMRQSYWEWYVLFVDGAFRRVPCYSVQEFNWDWYPLESKDDFKKWVNVGNAIDNPRLIKR